MGLAIPFGGQSRPGVEEVVARCPVRGAVHRTTKLVSWSSFAYVSSWCARAVVSRGSPVLPCLPRVCACPDVCYVQKSVVRALPSLSSETGGVVVRHEASRAQRRYLVDPASSICLSQRLSHACLSTSLTKVKPRMAH